MEPYEVHRHLDGLQEFERVRKDQQTPVGQREGDQKLRGKLLEKTRHHNNYPYGHHHDQKRLIQSGVDLV